MLAELVFSTQLIANLSLLPLDAPEQVLTWASTNEVKTVSGTHLNTLSVKHRQQLLNSENNQHTQWQQDKVSLNINHTIWQLDLSLLENQHTLTITSPDFDLKHENNALTAHFHLATQLPVLHLNFDFDGQCFSHKQTWFTHLALSAIVKVRECEQQSDWSLKDKNNPFNIKEIHKPTLDGTSLLLTQKSSNLFFGLASHHPYFQSELALSQQNITHNDSTQWLIDQRLSIHNDSLHINQQWKSWYTSLSLQANNKYQPELAMGKGHNLQHSFAISAEWKNDDWLFNSDYKQHQTQLDIASELNLDEFAVYFGDIEFNANTTINTHAFSINAQRPVPLFASTLGLQLHYLDYHIDYGYVLENKIFFGLITNEIERVKRAYMQGKLFAVELHSHSQWGNIVLNTQFKQWLPLLFEHFDGKGDEFDDDNSDAKFSDFDYQGQGLLMSLELGYQW